MPNKLVYERTTTARACRPELVPARADFPRQSAGIWHSPLGVSEADGVAPVLVGEFGGRSVGNDTEGVWQRTLLAYLQANGFDYTYWAWNPDSGDTGGVLDDDWTTLNHAKVAVLQAYQWPLLGVPRARLPAVVATSCPAADRAHLASRARLQQSPESAQSPSAVRSTLTPVMRCRFGWPERSGCRSPPGAPGGRAAVSTAARRALAVRRVRYGSLKELTGTSGVAILKSVAPSACEPHPPARNGCRRPNRRRSDSAEVLDVPSSSATAEPTCGAATILQVNLHRLTAAKRRPVNETTSRAVPGTPSTPPTASVRAPGTRGHLGLTHLARTVIGTPPATVAIGRRNHGQRR